MWHISNAHDKRRQEMLNSLNTAKSIFREILLELGENLNYQTMSQTLASKNLSEHQKSAVMLQFTQHNTQINSGVRRESFKEHSEMSSLTLESPCTSQESSATPSPISTAKHFDDPSILENKALEVQFKALQDEYAKRFGITNTSHSFYSATTNQSQEKNISHQHAPYNNKTTPK